MIIIGKSIIVVCYGSASCIEGQIDATELHEGMYREPSEPFVKEPTTIHHTGTRPDKQNDLGC